MINERENFAPQARFEAGAEGAEVAQPLHAHIDRAQVVALHDVSFSVARGEFVTVVGPSGCGKSTLLGLMAGVLQARQGTVAGAVLPIHQFSKTSLRWRSGTSGTTSERAAAARTRHAQAARLLGVA